MSSFEEMLRQALEASRADMDDSESLGNMMARSEKSADLERRRRQKDPSTTPRTVFSANMLNQRLLGRVNACTSYALGFVNKARRCKTSADITPDWVQQLLVLPEVPLPESGQHPDPIEAVMLSGCGLGAVDAEGKSTTDPVTVGPAFLPYDSLQLLLVDQLSLPQICGLLIVNGTETFGVAKFSDGKIGFFDPHGDSTQTNPAFCSLFVSREAAAQGITDIVDERSVFHREISGDATDVILLSPLAQ